jgi:dihydroflavonol-4-reductase
MKILVTGANGFLGSWLIRALIDRGFQVRAFVRAGGNLNALQNLPCEIHYGDVLEIATLEQAMQGVDVVFHLAAKMMLTPSQEEITRATNITGTRNVVTLCEKLKIKKLVHVSSVVAIGAGDSPSEIINEHSQGNFSQFKLANMDSKRKGEEIVRAACLDKKIDAVIVNPSLIYGPGDFQKEVRKGNIAVINGKMPFYTQGGVNVVAVQDVVEGIILAWQKGTNGERYILGGENLTIKQYFSLMAEAGGVKAPHWYLPSWILRLAAVVVGFLKIDSPLNPESVSTMLLYHWCSSAKAQRELGYEFRPAREAINSSVKWYQSQLALSSYRVILLDLDGTLLRAPRLLFLLANVVLMFKRMRPIFGWRQVVPSVHNALSKMFNNSADTGLTNSAVLISELIKTSKKSPDETRATVWKYYHEDFPRLEFLCRPVSGAKEFIESARLSGRQIFLVTNPIWPEECVHLRLKWAGLTPTMFDGITHSQNWHTCKPQLEYYQQVLTTWNLRPSDCVMIGDSPSKDGPAAKLGIHVKIIGRYFWKSARVDV